MKQGSADDPFADDVTEAPDDTEDTTSPPDSTSRAASGDESGSGPAASDQVTAQASRQSLPYIHA